MRNARGAVKNLGLITVLVLGWAAQSSADSITTFSTPLHFRWNIGANSVGLPAGDQHWVSVSNIAPTAGTTVTARQGAVTRPLPFTPFTFGPNLFRSLLPFDPALTGAWSITATNGPDSAGPFDTNPIANPQLLPLAQNIHVVGTGETPTIVWTLPDLTGFDVDSTRIFVHNDATDDHLFYFLLSGTPTQFTIPSGSLLPGVPYIFSVHLEDSEPFVLIENKSAAFTQSAYYVSESLPKVPSLSPTGLALLALLMLLAAGCALERRRA